ncbi:CAAX protease self-immunity [Natronoarchaeum philippinense]|uniref:CAAX protease self-immunity n=1 Tax=Natronoarchaeum philippinense TaxID=558529 RepID=A0A285NUK2_NATPI|nr:CPBP family intramembrane glutamic endopeptidase [Natronoarchaeum philippinense]SNZ13150.1 CAAX protease self-immunity [Natronoarchaeum philippinense]
MTQWAAFALVATVVLVVVLALARATQSASEQAPSSAARDGSQARQDIESRGVSSPRSQAYEDAAEHSSASPDSHTRQDAGSPTAASESSLGGARENAGEQTSPSPRSQAHEDANIRTLSTAALLANVVVTHGLLAAIVLVAAWAADIPATALGIDAAANVGWTPLAVGLGLGGALYAGNELLAAGFDRAGIEYDETLRGALGPDSIVGWIVLLGIALPIIAVFEELLFRAALIGALSAGFGVSPWVLAVISSLAFGLGHGIQGPTGVAVTGLLGFVLAAAFVMTGSLLTVVVAHYLINALEFLVHERLGVEW